MVSGKPAAPLFEETGPDRRPLRFLAFALAIVLGISGLTARLFYLQIARGTQYATLAETNRTVQQAIPSTRGLIYDRKGRPLVTNIPSFAVKVRPADLPFDQRPQVVQRLAALLNMDPAEINATIDTNPGSRFDLVRIAQDVPRDTADLIAESHLELPGVEVVVETQRRYAMGPLLAQILGYTGPVNADQLAVLKDQGYLPDDMIGKAGVEASYETQLRGTYGMESVERDATGRKIQVLQTVSDAKAGDSLRLTIDTNEQKLAQKALQWAMDKAGIREGVVIVENPQTGEILAMVSLPTYDNNDFATRISQKDFKKLLQDPNKPLTNHAVQDFFPPGSTYKLVTGTGGLGDGHLTPSTELVTRPYLTLGPTKFWDWNHQGFGRCDIMCGFGHSSDTFFFQVAGMLGIDRLAYWAHQYGFGQKTRIDLPGEVTGIVPSNAWKIQDRGEAIFAGEVYQAGIGQGYDAVTPIQLINAYSALVNGGKLMQPRVVREVIGPDGKVAKAFKPKVIRKLKVKPQILTEMRRAARQVILYWRGYHIFGLPIVVGGKSGTAEFGQRDAEGRLPYHSWFVGFVPKNPRPSKSDPNGFNAVARTDANLVVLAFAHDSRTVGNAAAEIAKYYLQLHFKLKGDFRNPERLVRGNFYEGN
jgi:penicillin-binding protein 2